jgi:predicted permease
MRVVGRLPSGISLERAQAESDALAADLRRRFPIKQTAGMYLRLEPIGKDLVADVRPAVLTLMGAVIFVLLIACANVANLLLVRMSTRTRELAVRAALGGSRWRLVRQLLTESLLLAIGGALLGLMLAGFGIDLLLRLRPDTLQRIDAVRIDPFVLGFTCATALAAAMLFGVLPALRASRPDLMDVLRSTGRTASLGGGHALRNVVVMAEVALAFVLLIGCGLMARSFIALQRTNPGYDPNRLLTFVVETQGPRFERPEARAAFMQQLRRRLEALPGVTGVTATTPLPLGGNLPIGRWGTEEARADPTKFQQATNYFVLPRYFETLRTALVDGRTFIDADNVEGSLRVVVDRRLAMKAFPGGSAVGRHILARSGRSAEAERFEIIGVVDHQRSVTLAAEGREAIYFVDGLAGHGLAQRWAVRSVGDPERLGSAVREAVRQIDPRLPIAEMQPMSAFVDRARTPTRFALALIGIFAGIAAVLAVGLYGVLSTTVRQRTAEIGVRVAFGAAPSNIFRLVVGRGLLLSAIGIALGLAAAFGLTRVMTTMLVGVEPIDRQAHWHPHPGILESLHPLIL